MKAELSDGSAKAEWTQFSVPFKPVGDNKYDANNWQLRNDLTGRVSFHNIDRNIDWPSPLG